MKIRNCLILSLLFINMSVFVSCSQEDVIADAENSLNDSDVATRAISDIFNVEAVAFSEGDLLWWDGPRGVDSKGNFYMILYTSEGDECTYKYDVDAGTFTPFVPFIDYLGPDCERFCFDEKDNLCYLIFDYINNRNGIRRVRADGNAITEQWLSGGIKPRSMSAALNGNMFILASSGDDDKIYRLSPNGVLTDIGVDLSGIFATALYKASGTTLYLLESSYWDKDRWYKINTNLGTIEELDLRTPANIEDIRMVTSSNTKANLYTIRDNYVIQLRPNAATDLVIGTIPSSYKDENGQFQNIVFNNELYVNSEATIFYIMNEYGFYKLTLD